MTLNERVARLRAALYDVGWDDFAQSSEEDLQTLACEGGAGRVNGRLLEPTASTGPVVGFVEVSQ
jgi:hypothetical protein